MKSKSYFKLNIIPFFKFLSSNYDYLIYFYSTKAFFQLQSCIIDWFWISDEGVPSETEEERKLEAAKAARIKELTSKFINKGFTQILCCLITAFNYSDMWTSSY